MKVREENCNMVLLAAVTLVSAIVAGGVALLEPAPAQEMAQAPPGLSRTRHRYASSARPSCPTPIRTVADNRP